MRLPIICMYVLIAVLALAADAAWSGPLDPPLDSRGSIALDPGHGGKQHGGHGPQGFAEKEICLALARRLALLLEPDYRVILTRADDYDVPLTERAGVANHQRADLFISLHTAAGFVPATTGITIYTFKSAAPQAAALERSSKEGAGIVDWHHTQLSHGAASRKLATLLQQQFEAMPGAPAVRITEAPLLVLAGADMPAVLIEAGYLSHAATEARLNAPEGQSIYAQAMARAIDSFMEAKRQPPQRP